MKRGAILKKNSLRLPVFLYGFLPAACCLLKGLSDRLYTDIDSFLISINCAGLYGESNLCPVLHPLVGLLTNGLNHLYPNVDWFTALGQFFTIVAVWWIGVLLAFCIQQPFKRWTCLLLFSLVLLQQSLLNQNFTVYAGLFAAVAVATLLLSFRRSLPRISYFMVVLFICLAILWRKEGTALILPFLILDLCVLALSKVLTWQHIRRVLVLALLPATLLLTISLGTNITLPAQGIAVSYGQYRAKLIDYPHHSWEDIYEELTPLSISENDYAAITKGILLDTDLVTASTLEKISAVATTSEFSFSPNTIFLLLGSLPSVFNTQLLRSFILLALGLFVGILCSHLPPLYKLEAFLALGGSCLICLYYLYIGRLPERVTACILLAFITTLLPLFLCIPASHIPAIKSVWQISSILVIGLLCIFLIQNRYNYRIVQPVWQARQAEVSDFSLRPEQDADSIYLWNSTLLALYMTDHYMDEGKLPDTAFLRQNLAWGEWNTSGQITYQQLLSGLGVANPMQSLLNRPHTYLVGEKNDIILIQTWLREHYDTTATAEQIDTIDVFAVGKIPIWQIANE